MKKKLSRYTSSNYIKFILGSGLLLILLGKSIVFSKIASVLHTSPAKEEKDKQLASAKSSTDTDDTSYLFVDCTGFFE